MRTAFSRVNTIFHWRDSLKHDRDFSHFVEVRDIHLITHRARKRRPGMIHQTKWLSRRRLRAAGAVSGRLHLPQVGAGPAAQAPARAPHRLHQPQHVGDPGGGARRLRGLGWCCGSGLGLFGSWRCCGRGLRVRRPSGRRQDSCRQQYSHQRLAHGLGHEFLLVLRFAGCRGHLAGFGRALHSRSDGTIEAPRSYLLLRRCGEATAGR